MSTVTRRDFLRAAGLGAAALAAGGPARGARNATRRPNIVIILTDDQGWGDLSVHGNTNSKTPNIDSLAKGAARFDRFYVSPVCAPTRAALLTGRYYPRTGVVGVTRGQERMNLDEVTIADVFKAAGYATGAFGKWHNGSQYPYHPNGRGFDEFYGFCCGHWSNYFDTILDHNGREVRGKGFIIDDLTDKAMAFMTKNRDKPFLCYVPYNTPHSPFQVPDEYYDRLQKRRITMFNRDKKREETAKTRSALAMCENIDWNVGRIVKRITGLGLTKDTIVLYFSDNGPNSWRWNDRMLGRKGSVQEGGVRVPFIIRWPGRIKAGTKIEEIAADIDILPTLADLAGASTAKCKPLDGISLKPLLDGRTENRPDRMIFSTLRNRVSVRTLRYRADPKGLYDMVSDPSQTKNIARQRPEVHGKLVEAIRRWQKDVFASRTTDRPYPVGYRRFPLTVLPAQDSVQVGKTLRFSSRHPNCSWLTGWTDTQAHVYWDIEVATAGRYEVAVMYTCGAKDVGSDLEVAFGQRRVKGKITEPYDPPLIESPDRVKRQESFEKPFQALKLGVLALPKGRGKLILRAISKPGRQVMDLRALKLRLL